MESTFYLLLLQYLIYCWLVGMPNVAALVGTKIRDAKPEELPSVVSIGQRYNHVTNIEDLQFCTGTLISLRHVLTAAHCLYGLSVEDIVIIAGHINLYEGQHLAIKNWITYDIWAFGPQTPLVKYSHNDLAIITLEKLVNNPKIQPSKVLKFIREDLYGSKLRIAGWGNSENGKVPDVLKTGAVTVLTKQKCQDILQVLTNEPNAIDEQFFCSRANPYILSSCGDSGAPLFNKQGMVVGINLGACPAERQMCNISKEFVCQNQINFHLHVHHYRHFIICLTLGDQKACILKDRN